MRKNSSLSTEAKALPDGRQPWSEIRSWLEILYQFLNSNLPTISLPDFSACMNRALTLIARAASNAILNYSHSLFEMNENIEEISDWARLFQGLCNRYAQHRPALHVTITLVQIQVVRPVIVVVLPSFANNPYGLPGAHRSRPSQNQKDNSPKPKGPG